MLNWIDNFLNRITMYRLVLYYLIFLLLAALVLSFFGLLSYGPFSLLFSTLFILAISWIVNKVFATTYNAPANVESIYITALILALIITPPQISANYRPFLVFAGWAALWAMASKFIFAIGKKHIFNPAAFAVALTALTIGKSASWWVGTAVMLPFVLVGGLLVVRKVRRFDLVFGFLSVGLVIIYALSITRGNSAFFEVMRRVLLNSPILFFAFVMLTEPLTTPPGAIRQTLYGAFVGLLFSPSVHVGSLYSTPELALLAGNVFSYLIGPKEKLMLTLKKKIPIGPTIYDFVFRPDRSFSFKPGQYLEWTLGHDHPDNRGNRRYFTIASSPTEQDVHMGVKFYPEASSFKQSLLAMQNGDTIVASQLSGDFTLPRNKKKKITLIAGGIGITPFRSMIKYLLDHNEQRDVVLMYSNSAEADIAYYEIFNQAQERLGLRTIYTLTDSKRTSNSWQGERRPIDREMIMEEIPDYQERFFYLSGPRSMVVSFERILRDMGVPKRHIRIDFFPGFA